MKRLLSVLVLTALSANPGMALQNAGGIVEGHVVRADTSEPIPGAQIKLRKYVPVGVTETEVSTTSDGNGLFHFENVSPGSYLAEVRHDGYFGLFFGSTIPWYQTDITVPRQQDLRNVTFPMLPGGSLSGSVLDLNGQPAGRVTVSLIRANYADTGETQLINEQQVDTDAGGRYRFSLVPPGRHYLRAGRPFSPVSQATSILFSYFPGTSDFSQAKPVEIAPAKETLAADIKLQAMPVFSVSGRIIYTVPPALQNTSPEAAARLDLRLVPLDPAVARYFGSNSFENLAQDSSNGQFQIRGVPQGIYDLAATVVIGRSIQPAGHTRIEVAGSDLQGVELLAYPGVDLKGHIVTDGDASALSAMAQDYMNIWPVLNGSSGLAQIDSKGNFTFPSVADGTYRLPVAMRLTVPSGLPTCLTDIRQGTRSIREDGIITVDKGQAEPIELHITSSCGIVRGRVTDHGMAVSGALVVLLPDDAGLQNPNLRQGTNSDSGGEFAIRGVPPGRYKVFAWVADPSGNDRIPDYRLKDNSLGTPVVVSPGAPSQVQLELISLRER